MERYVAGPRKLSSAALALIAVYALHGCSDAPRFDESQPAQISGKTFTPEHTVTENGQCLIRRSGLCFLYDTYEEVIPDQYSVELEQCAAKTPDEEPTCAVQDVDISRNQFLELQEDQWVKISPDGAGLDRVNP